MTSSYDPHQVSVWYDPRLPAPDSQAPLYQGQDHVRRLNGPKRPQAVDAHYQEYHELYAQYLEQRLPFLNKPRCIPQANGKILAWEDVLAQKLRDIGGANATASARRTYYDPLVALTQQVQDDYLRMWNDLTATIDKLANCAYVHDFGGRAHTRILDKVRGVDVTAGVEGVPLKNWASVTYEPDASGERYDVRTQTAHLSAGVVVQQYESHYSAFRPPQGGDLTIVKDPRTTQRYKGLLWAAVNGQ